MKLVIFGHTVTSPWDEVTKLARAEHTPVTLDALRKEGTVDYVPAQGLVDFDLVLSYTGGEAWFARHVSPPHHPEFYSLQLPAEGREAPIPHVAR